MNSYDDLTEKKLVAPLKDEDSSVYQSGLRLVSVQWTVTDDPFHANWLTQDNQGLNICGTPIK